MEQTAKRPKKSAERTITTTLFRAKMNEYIKICKKTRKPLIISSYGKEEVAVISLEDLEALRGIQKGMKEISEGKGIPQEKVFAKLRERFG
jgi:prevent-host-death family protein